MNKYTAKEVSKLTGLSEYSLKDMTRKTKFGQKKHKQRFQASFPGSAGVASYFSDEDISILKEYVDSLNRHQKIIKKMRSTVK